MTSIYGTMMKLSSRLGFVLIAAACSKGSSEKAPPAPQPQPVPAVAPKRTEAVKTPSCLGFSADGRSAYVLVGDKDFSASSWTLSVAALGGGSADGLSHTAETTDEAAANEAFAPLVERVDAFVAKQALSACMTWPKTGEKVKASIGGKEITISAKGDSIVLAVAGGATIKRERLGGNHVAIAAAYSGSDQSSLVVVSEVSGEGGLHREDAEFFDASAFAAPAKAGVDKNLIRTLGDATEVSYTAPTGETVKVEVAKRLQGKSWVVDVIAGGKVLATIDSKIEDGDIHYEPRAQIGLTKDGVVAVGGTVKVTGKPDDAYDARLLTWDAGKQALVISRKVAFADSYTEE